ncbi:potassium-transporting ATPase subunit F [Mycobacteroides abscessus]
MDYRRCHERHRQRCRRHLADCPVGDPVVYLVVALLDPERF